MKILFKSAITNVNPAKFVYDVLGEMSDKASYDNKVEVSALKLKDAINRNDIKNPEQFLEDVSARVKQMISQEKKEKEKAEYERKIKEELVPAIDNFFAGFLDKNPQKYEELKEKLKVYLGIGDNRYYTPTEVTNLLREIIPQKYDEDKDNIYETTLEEHKGGAKYNNEYFRINTEYIDILSEFGITAEYLFRYYLREDFYIFKDYFKNILMFNVDILKKVLESKRARFKTLETIEKEVKDIEL